MSTFNITINNLTINQSQPSDCVDTDQKKGSAAEDGITIHVDTSQKKGSAAEDGISIRVDQNLESVERCQKDESSSEDGITIHVDQNLKGVETHQKEESSSENQVTVDRITIQVGRHQESVSCLRDILLLCVANLPQCFSQLSTRLLELFDQKSQHVTRTGEAGEDPPVAEGHQDAFVSGENLLVSPDKSCVATKGKRVPGENLLVSPDKSCVAGKNLLVSPDKSCVATKGKHVPGENLLVSPDKSCVPGENLPVSPDKSCVAGKDLLDVEDESDDSDDDLLVLLDKLHVATKGKHVPGKNLLVSPDKSCVPGENLLVSPNKSCVTTKGKHVPGKNLLVPPDKSHVATKGKHVPGKNLLVSPDVSYDSDEDLLDVEDKSHVTTKVKLVPGKNQRVLCENLQVATQIQPVTEDSTKNPCCCLSSTCVGVLLAEKTPIVGCGGDTCSTDTFHGDTFCPGTGGGETCSTETCGEVSPAGFGEDVSSSIFTHEGNSLKQTCGEKQSLGPVLSDTCGTRQKPCLGDILSDTCVGNVSPSADGTRQKPCPGDVLSDTCGTRQKPGVGNVSPSPGDILSDTCGTKRKPGVGNVSPSPGDIFPEKDNTKHVVEDSGVDLVDSHTSSEERSCFDRKKPSSEKRQGETRRRKSVKHNLSPVSPPGKNVTLSFSPSDVFKSLCSYKDVDVKRQERNQSYGVRNEEKMLRYLKTRIPNLKRGGWFDKDVKCGKEKVNIHGKTDAETEDVIYEFKSRTSAYQYKMVDRIQLELYLRGRRKKQGALVECFHTSECQMEAAVKEGLTCTDACYRITYYKPDDIVFEEVVNYMKRVQSSKRR